MEHRTDQERSDQLAVLVVSHTPAPPAVIDIDVLELVLSGGCAVCEYEADQMCAGCGSCACDRHDACVRPDEQQLGGAA